MSDSVDQKKVMVVGGGFAGMTASLLLAEQGCQVVLVEKEAAIGGFFPLLDNTFPTNSCGVCFLSPRQPAYCPFVECRLRDNLRIMVNSQPLAFSGGPGDFTVQLRVDPRGVNQEKCLDCGQCSAVCPVSVPEEFSDGLESRPAIYKQYPKMVKAGYRIDFAACTRCGACVEACPTGAIDLELAPREVEEQVDAILLTPGFSLVDGGLRGEYGFGRYANVITSRQMERLISASGPTGGQPRLPGSGEVPQKVAFIQCVGSRDRSCGRGYCSSVCCMYATKQAMFLKEKVPAAEVTIFYMDIRGVGKDYERYFNRARDEYGINYQRSLISTVKEDPGSGRLRLMFADQGRRREAEFDLVVLSLGFDAPELAFAGQLDDGLDEYGFCRVDEFQPARTPVPGVYAAGAFTGPKDVPETVMEAAGAADVVADELGLTPGPAADAGDDAAPGGWEKVPRIGVFLCRCDGLLAEQLDLEALEADHACQPDGLEAIREAVKADGLNRLVIGGCSVRELAGREGDFAGRIGLDPAACGFANLREQCAWVHDDDRQAATAKARSLLQAAVTQVARAAAAPPRKTTINQQALVIGGGVAGMTAALSLARRGFPVTLLEKEAELGGRLARESFYTLRGG
ncbi:MAG: CoB--CoM heterodisulfide reductase iron-sulfur subunit A family protein, partial [Deltaproteobacteria bacterium]|nr:CoB--CoM heterodisulfide reductase iron-sulfur subunit A family protein [Deltaproteobacteria bacterium]